MSFLFGELCNSRVECAHVGKLYYFFTWKSRHVGVMTELFEERNVVLVIEVLSWMHVIILYNGAPCVIKTESLYEIL